MSYGGQAAGNVEIEHRPMDDIEGYSLAEQSEHLAERFKPPSAAAVPVTLTAAQSRSRCMRPCRWRGRTSRPS